MGETQWRRCHVSLNPLILVTICLPSRYLSHCRSQPWAWSVSMSVSMGVCESVCTFCIWVGGRLKRCLASLISTGEIQDREGPCVWRCTCEKSQSSVCVCMCEKECFSMHMYMQTASAAALFHECILIDCCIPRRVLCSKAHSLLIAQVNGTFDLRFKSLVF